jgi:hypothetical protein
MDPTDQSPHRLLALMISGYWTSQAVYATAKLGLADLLGTGAKTAEELAAATGTHARALYRLLRALAGAGLFVEQPDGKFTLTELGSGLLSDVPG